jgi:hypothetical protein
MKARDEKENLRPRYDEQFDTVRWPLRRPAED